MMLRVVFPRIFCDHKGAIYQRTEATAQGPIQVMRCPSCRCMVFERNGKRVKYRGKQPERKAV